MGTMNASDWFGIIIRYFGIYGLFQGAQNALYFCDVRFGFSEMRDVLGRDDPAATPNSYLLYAAGYSLLGVCFVRYADDIVRWSFKLPSKIQSLDEQPPESNPPEASA
jgi:hypothetical protein